MFQDPVPPFRQTPIATGDHIFHLLPTRSHLPSRLYLPIASFNRRNTPHCLLYFDLFLHKTFTLKRDLCFKSQYPSHVALRLDQAHRSCQQRHSSISRSRFLLLKNHSTRIYKHDLFDFKYFSHLSCKVRRHCQPASGILAYIGWLEILKVAHCSLGRSVWEDRRHSSRPKLLVIELLLATSISELGLL